MRIKEVDTFWILFYPSLLNPSTWVVLIVYFFGSLLFGWIPSRKSKRYPSAIDPESRSDNFKSRMRLCLDLLIAGAVNVIWWDRKRALAYGDYKSYKALPAWPPGTYQYAKNVEERYKRYAQIKDKRVIY